MTEDFDADEDPIEAINARLDEIVEALPPADLMSKLTGFMIEFEYLRMDVTVLRQALVGADIPIPLTRAELAVLANAR